MFHANLQRQCNGHLQRFHNAVHPTKNLSHLQKTVQSIAPGMKNRLGHFIQTSVSATSATQNEFARFSKPLKEHILQHPPTHSGKQDYHVLEGAVGVSGY